MLFRSNTTPSTPHHHDPAAIFPLDHRSTIITIAFPTPQTLCRTAAPAPRASQNTKHQDKQAALHASHRYVCWSRPLFPPSPPLASHRRRMPVPFPLPSLSLPPHSPSPPKTLTSAAVGSRPGPCLFLSQPLRCRPWLAASKGQRAKSPGHLTSDRKSVV